MLYIYMFGILLLIEYIFLVKIKRSLLITINSVMNLHVYING